ncbi:hypothetical protein [Streptomyces sp. NPDC001930]|uniref:hypothetical protein n=1 Tax=Streptomyces sp. NPDC001930 TaxID=3364625 RepID=UPI00367AAB7D
MEASDEGWLSHQADPDEATPLQRSWALWKRWSDGDLKVTMVVSAVETTEGLLKNWGVSL